MVEVIRYAKEHPGSINQLAGNDDDDAGLIASSLSDVVDVDGTTHASISVDVTRVGGTQPIPITLSVAAANDGMTYQLDNLSQTAGGTQLSALTPSADVRQPGGSWSAEMSSDAEYYTPVGSPDESSQLSAGNTVILVDEVSAAAALTAALVGKVINVFYYADIPQFSLHAVRGYLPKLT